MQLLLVLFFASASFPAVASASEDVDLSTQERLRALESEVQQLRSQLASGGSVADASKAVPSTLYADFAHSSPLTINATTKDDPSSLGISSAVQEDESHRRLGAIFAETLNELAALAPELAIELSTLAALGALIYLVMKRNCMPSKKDVAVKVDMEGLPHVYTREQLLMGRLIVKRTQPTESFGAQWRVESRSKDRVAPPGLDASEAQSTIQTASMDPGAPPGLECFLSAQHGHEDGWVCSNDASTCVSDAPVASEAISEEVDENSSAVTGTDFKQGEPAEAASHFDTPACSGTAAEAVSTESVSLSLVDGSDGVQDPIPAASSGPISIAEELPERVVEESEPPVSLKDGDTDPITGIDAELLAPTTQPSQVAQQRPRRKRGNAKANVADQSTAAQVTVHCEADTSDKKAADPDEHPLTEKSNPLEGGSSMERGLTWIKHCFARNAEVATAPPDAVANSATLDRKSGKRGKAQKPTKQIVKSAPACRAPRGTGSLQIPCSWPLMVAMSVMLMIVLGGRVSFGPQHTTQQLSQMVENRKIMTAERTRLQRKLALLELDEFEAKAEKLLAEMPESREAKKLESARSDAHDLNVALQDVSDEEFPQVKKGVDDMVAHWMGVLGKARALADGATGESCASSPSIEQKS